MIPLMVAGALMGMMKHQKDASNEDADRKLASETARYSPWTKMTPGPIRRANASVMDVGQGAMSGAMFGQQFGNMGWGDSSFKDGSVGSDKWAGNSAAPMGAPGGMKDYGGSFNSWDDMLNQQPGKKPGFYTA